MAELDQSFFGLFENIILTKNGVWLSNGEEILHERTCLAFARNIYRCKDGFEIRLGNEKKVFHVEDTVYFVTSLEGSPNGGYTLRLNDGRKEVLDASTLQYRPGRLTCRVTNPNEDLHEEAKFLSTAYYELLNHIEHDAKGYSVEIQGKKIVLG